MPARARDHRGRDRTEGGRNEPPGAAYRRWTIGTTLPGLFLATTYYYDDWRGLGIEPPPWGRRWVRYGPDLLLINVRNRRVEDVIYGVFY